MSIQGGGYSSGDMITGGGLATFRGTITEKMNARAYWLDRFWDIRGELAKRGMRQGLVIVISATHRFYGLPIDLRADVDLLLARSTATPGTFDARVVENMLGLLTCAELRIHETKALHDRTELSWAGYRTKSSFGLVRVPRATEAQMVTVYSKPKSRRSKQPWWGPLLLLAGTLAALALLLNPWW